MQLKSFTYHPTLGWSVPTFPELDGDQTLVLVSGCPSLSDNPLPIRELRDAYPRAQIFGGSSAGDIVNSHVFDGGLAATVVEFDRTSIKSASVPVRGMGKSFDAGRRLAEKLDAEDLAAVLLVADGQSVNGSEIARGLNDVFDDRVVVSGAMTCDGSADVGAWVLKGGEPQSGWVSAIAMYGDAIDVRVTQGEGWSTFGPARAVTRADANVLYELDEKPALDLLVRYLGEYADELPAAAHHFPLVIRQRNELIETELVRSAIDVDPHDKSLRFAGNVPANAVVHLARPDLDRLLACASEAADEALTGCDDTSPVLAFTVSHVGRRLALGARVGQELLEIRSRLPEGSVQAGLFALGEFAPNEIGESDLFNMTLTLTTIQEAA